MRSPVEFRLRFHDPIPTWANLTIALFHRLDFDWEKAQILTDNDRDDSQKHSFFSRNCQIDFNADYWTANYCRGLRFLALGLIAGLSLVIRHP